MYLLIFSFFSGQNNGFWNFGHNGCWKILPPLCETKNEKCENFSAFIAQFKDRYFDLKIEKISTNTSLERTF